MPVLLDAIKRIKDEFGDTVCVTGRVAAPLSSVTLLYGMMPTYLGIYDNPQLVKDTVKFFTEMQTLWGIEQINRSRCIMGRRLQCIRTFNQR